MTKRYLLFCGHAYYPEGGWHDFKASFNDPESAIAEGQRLSETTEDYGDGFWWHVVDFQDRVILRDARR